MTSRLITFVLFPCLIIALLLALAGVRQVEFGDSYYQFMGDVSRAYSQWSFEIPDIPKITPMNDGGFDSGGLIISVLIKIGNFFVNVINGLISVLNVLILIINVVISLIQFALTLIYCLLGFRNRVAGSINLI